MAAAGGGSIINTASGWGLAGGPRAAVYCASKGAVVLLTKADLSPDPDAARSAVESVAIGVDVRNGVESPRCELRGLGPVCSLVQPYLVKVVIDRYLAPVPGGHTPLDRFLSSRPLVGRSRPLKCFTRVVLPSPFFPISATRSPVRI